MPQNKRAKSRKKTSAAKSLTTEVRRQPSPEAVQRLRLYRLEQLGKWLTNELEVMLASAPAPLDEVLPMLREVKAATVLAGEIRELSVMVTCQTMKRIAGTIQEAA